MDGVDRTEQGGPSAPGFDVLAELFSSRVRANVLAFMVAQEEARFSLTELSRALDLSVSSVQHECYKLERLGVLNGRREGASRRYWLNRELSFVPVLMWLVLSVLGRDYLLAFATRGTQGLDGAILAPDPTPSLALIGTLALEDADAIQARIARILEIDESALNVALFDSATWYDHVRSNNPAISAFREGSPVLLAGAVALLPGKHG